MDWDERSKRIWRKFSKVKDLTITNGMDGDTETSLVLLSMCSSFLRGIFSASNEANVLMLPGFSGSAIRNLMRFVQDGEAEDSDDLRELIGLLQLNCGSDVSVISTPRKRKVLDGTMSSGEEDSGPPVTKKTRNRKKFDGPITNEVLRKERFAMARLSVRPRGHFGPKEAIDFSGVDGNGLQHCQFCKEPTRTSLDCLKHIKSLVGSTDKPYILSLGPNNLEACRLCYRTCRDNCSMRFHLIDHIQEIHHGVRHCALCDKEFPTMVEYIIHLPVHAFKESSAETKQCPHCRKNYKVLSFNTHVKVCKSRPEEDLECK